MASVGALILSSEGSTSGLNEYFSIALLILYSSLPFIYFLSFMSSIFFYNFLRSTDCLCWILGLAWDKAFFFSIFWASIYFFLFSSSYTCFFSLI